MGQTWEHLKITEMLELIKILRWIQHNRQKVVKYKLGLIDS